MINMDETEENYFEDVFNGSEDDRDDDNEESKNKDIIVLKPDHPLMQKFQTTLNDFLQEENERLRIEILELKENLKKERHDYEKQMGHEVFNFEQELNQQRKLLTEYEEKFEFIRYRHNENNQKLKLQKEAHKRFGNKLDDDKKKNSQLLGELEALTLLCKQYEAWEKDTNSELIVQQRISEKMHSEKLSIMEEKRKIDMMVYRMKMEIWNLEAEMSLVDEQTTIKTEEIEDIIDRIANSSADLEALEVEQQRLLQLWNSVVISIQQKDKTLTSINQDYENAETKLKTLTQNIESTKKEIDEEMRNHEKIIIKKNRCDLQVDDCLKTIEIQEIQRNLLESALMEISSALELTEKDLQIEISESTKNKSAIKAIMIQYEKLVTEKINLENETLDRLQNRLNDDKTIDDIIVKIKKFKNDTRKNELNMLNMENQLSKVMLKIEKQRYINCQRQILMNDDKTVFEKKEHELNAMEAKLKDMLNSIEKNQSTLDAVNKKIYTFLDKNEGSEKSPIERKIEESENKIKEFTNIAEELRRNWMRMQKHVIHLTRKYEKQISDNILIQQQMHVMEYKLSKAKDRIRKQEEDKNSIQRLVDMELHKIEILSKEKLNNKTKNKTLQEKYNDFTIDSMAKLKDMEDQLLLVKDEIAELENEKECLAIEIDKLERNMKHWKKMEILAVETKQKVKEEKSATGEIGRMKMEIHRMQVRQGQVTRTAGRLASDLAQAVWRRAAAVYRNRAMSQKNIPQCTYSTKNKEKRSDIRRINQEIEMNQNKLQIMNDEQSVVKKDIQEKRIVFATLENEIAKLKQQVNEDYLHKQANLERIIRNQRYGQHCALVLSGRIRVHNVKSESIITIKYEKEQKINSQLIDLTTTLISEMPEYKTMLTRVLNTLSVNEE